MRDGPRGFGQDYSCPALLRWRLKRDRLPVRGCHPLCRRFPDGFPFPRAPSNGAPTTPGRPQPPRFGLIPFRSPLLGESIFLSFPAGIEMFQFPALAPLAGCAPSKRAGCPIRTPPDLIALPGEFRRSTRPSSPPEAKASAVCPSLVCLLPRAGRVAPPGALGLVNLDPAPLMRGGDISLFLCSLSSSQ